MLRGDYHALIRNFCLDRKRLLRHYHFKHVLKKSRNKREKCDNESRTEPGGYRVGCLRATGGERIQDLCGVNL